MSTKEILVDRETWRLLKIESARKETSILKLASDLLGKALDQKGAGE